MRRAKSTTAIPSVPKIAETDTTVWESLQVFPAALAGRDGELREKALAKLAKIGPANLRYLCEEAKVTRPPKAGATVMAKHLLAAAPNDTLPYLFDFARRREQSIIEQYEVEFTEPERRSHEAEIDNLTEQRAETPRTFTKLLLMYLRDAGVLGRIHYRHLWREARTAEEYEIDALPPNAQQKLEKEIGGLITELKRLPDGKQLTYRGSHQMHGGPRIYVLQRAYRPKVVPEFPNTFHLFRGYGFVIFGLYEDGPARIEVKVGNQKYVQAIADWGMKALGVPFRRSGLTVYDEYDAADLEKKLLGHHTEEHGLAVIGIKMRRTSLPNHPSITVEASSGKATVREALAWYLERGAISLRSLSDVEWLRVHFGGHEGLIKVELTPDGSVRFDLDNSGWPEGMRTSLGNAFQQTFGIPLARRVSAKPLSMGALEIFQSLLEWADADEVHQHQRKLFEFLVEKQILSVHAETLRTCTTASCKRRNKSVDDDQVENCAKCHQPLRVKRTRKIDHDLTGIRGFIGRLLKLATGWDLDRSPVQFENNEFYPLRNPARPDESVSVFLSKRISPSKIEVFDRSMWPVLVVHTSGTYEHAHLDLAGIAHLGLAYALAAAQDREIRGRFILDCKSMLERLQRNEQERVLRAARASREMLGKDHGGCTGGMYESAVFGLIRSIFPHTMKWGGKFRPDGFSALLFSKSNRLNELQKFNWSYDSKYSERHGGYEFGAGEHRKLFDYVTALAEQKELQVDGNQLDAHVIITNALDEARMIDAAKFLRCEHRLGSDMPGFRLVFMMEEFLVTLYDRVRKDEVEFMKRWGYLSQRLAWHMQQVNCDGYVLLRTEEACCLSDWVLAKPPIETPVDIQQVQDSLDDMMSGK